MSHRDPEGMTVKELVLEVREDVKHLRADMDARLKPLERFNIATGFVAKVLMFATPLGVTVFIALR